MHYSEDVFTTCHLERSAWELFFPCGLIGAESKDPDQASYTNAALGSSSLPSDLARTPWICIYSACILGMFQLRAKEHRS